MVFIGHLVDLIRPRLALHLLPHRSLDRHSLHLGNHCLILYLQHQLSSFSLNLLILHLGLFVVFGVLYWRSRLVLSPCLTFHHLRLNCLCV